MSMDNEDTHSQVLAAFMASLLVGSVALTTWRTLVAHQFDIVDDITQEEAT